MKKLIYIILPCAMLFFTACEEDFINLTPPGKITDAVYYTEIEHFKTGSNKFYTDLLPWTALGDFLDHASDLTGYKEDSPIQTYSRGDSFAPVTDDFYNDAYTALRDINLLIERAANFSGDASDISEYVAVAKFFRAYHHFALVQRFGGVNIVTRSLDVDSEEANSPRNSRYEVVAQVLTDLNDAIAGLPREQDISSTDKGKISKWAAMAFKAKILLHEATWMRYVGITTDGDGVASGAGSTGFDAANIDLYLQEAVTASKTVMDQGGFELWNHNDVLDNMSSYYLFMLEDSESNPAGLDKSSNNEYIFYGKYDFLLRQGRALLSHTSVGRLLPSRKMIDLFLADDGLPIDKSPRFQGYTNASDEYQNRDYRMRAYFTNNATHEIPEDGSVLLTGQENYGYYNSKFVSWKWPVYRDSYTESPDLPYIRLAEVYLTYAEALYELNGGLTDAQMNESINLVKERAGLPAMNNTFLTLNGMDLKTEIRRERTIELYAENSRYNDLRRWGLAEQELNQDIFGAVIEGTAYEGNTALYTPGSYIYGEKTATTAVGPRRCILLEPESVRNFDRNNYLHPLPTSLFNTNDNLLQNPGY
ncbi:RagB/SusD family nutrient uptake outer membrane protein [Mariniflexile sp. AS56]|uniref:RagB/SusD family nutrient uptake outer membrane protein n=1 Tax=Mariniflexile sp. AS56 TaxID=3063957 RepID=UPI0026ED1977|nr:RagB/SusD family nutrient uptake outer membrane protein [Mariniflexile sp. AS56]MDO7171574.1 RagB/SusD family nutrient uptake outer membrane protein [Mariniflexile sp. AS56]